MPASDRSQPNPATTIVGDEIIISIDEEGNVDIEVFCCGVASEMTKRLRLALSRCG